MSLPNPFLHPLTGRIVLLLGALMSFFYNLGGATLFDLDEGAFSEATREMLANGNYLSTYLGGEHRWDKPILIYWFMAASAHLFGFSEWSMRLPSAFFALAWAGMIFFFSKRLWGETVAFWSTFMMITALQITIIAKAAIADALLNFCITGAMFSIFLFYREQKNTFLYLTFVFMGLGLLTKGPIAVAVPFIVSFLFFGIKRDLRMWLKAVLNPKGLFILCAIAMPWYIAEYRLEGQAFIDGFFLKHNVNRFAGSLEGHTGSPFYYIPVLLLGFLPFTALLMRSLSRIKELINDDFALFGLLWFGFVFLFFSLGGTKLPHYIIYGYTPLFIIMARFGALKSVKWYFIPLFLLLLSLLALPQIALLVEPHVKEPLAKVILTNAKHYFTAPYYLVIGSVGGLIAYALIDKRFLAESKLLLSAILMLIIVNGIIVPIYAKMAQEPVKNAALIAKRDNLNVVLWNLNMPTFMFYAEKTAERRTPKEGEIALTKITNLPKLEHYDILYQEGAFAMIRVVKFQKSGQ